MMERFFLSLKTERVWQRDYANHAEAMMDIADYIVGFYNSVRLHSKLGNLPPNAFEQQSAIKLPIVVSEKTDQHTQVRIISSGTDQRRAGSFAPPSPAKKRLTTLSLNSVWYVFMKPLEVCPASGISSQPRAVHCRERRHRRSQWTRLCESC